MSHPLDGVRAKIARAEEHAQLLEREVTAFFNADPPPLGTSVGYFDPESGWHRVFGFVREAPPLRLGVILGDLVHNVRSALDHLVWQLVLLDGETPSRDNTFPVASTEGDWKATVDKRLAGVSSSHRAIIESVQPFKGPHGPENTYTAALSHLSNVDKHRIVHATAAVILDPGAGPHRASFRVVEGEAEIAQKQVNLGERIEHGAELMRARTEPPDSDVKVVVEGDIPGDIAFGERRVRLGFVKNLPQAARVIVKEFEADFPEADDSEPASGDQ